MIVVKLKKSWALRYGKMLYRTSGAVAGQRVYCQTTKAKGVYEGL